MRRMHTDKQIVNLAKSVSSELYYHIFSFRGTLNEEEVEASIIVLTLEKPLLYLLKSQYFKADAFVSCFLKINDTDLYFLKDAQYTMASQLVGARVLESDTPLLISNVTNVTEEIHKYTDN